MMKIIPSQHRYYADHGWLKTRWHFSFSDYYDPANMNWGALRVFNDDIIEGDGGFDPHPHHDMEIVTIVLEGALRHQDNLDHVGHIRPGEVQVMSAGTGIVHAEYNNSATERLRLMQLWIMPRHGHNTPRWEQKPFDLSKTNALLPVVSAGEIPGTLAIDQDARIYLANLTAGSTVSHPLGKDRKGYLFVIDGQMTLNGHKLSAGDQARIASEPALEMSAATAAKLIYLDLPPIN